MMKYKSVELLAKEDVWKKFEEEALFNGRDTHNLIVSFIETYIKTRKYLPIQKENYEILTKY